MSEAPPSYYNSMQQNQGYPGYQQSYGAMGPPPAGAYHPTGYPAQGGYDPSKAAGAYQAAPGYPPPAGAVPSYHQSSNTNVIVQQAQPVVVVGGCPACRVGILEEDFTCLGVLCAILFFPIGILCCLAMRQRRCANCGAVFG